jgi:hypothetical protein
MNYLMSQVKVKNVDDKKSEERFASIKLQFSTMLIETLLPSDTPQLLTLQHVLNTIEGEVCAYLMKGYRCFQRFVGN